MIILTLQFVKFEGSLVNKKGMNNKKPNNEISMYLIVSGQTYE